MSMGYMSLVAFARAIFIDVQAGHNDKSARTNCQHIGNGENRGGVYLAISRLRCRKHGGDGHPKSVVVVPEEIWAKSIRRDAHITTQKSATRHSVSDAPR